MSSTCAFHLTGTVNGDPEVKTSNRGTQICTVLLNCQVQKFSGSGVEVDYKDYDVTGFGKIAERLAQLVNGSMVAIGGDIDSRTYARGNGGEGRAYEFVARDIAVLSDGAGGEPTF
jgi:single-stranded DNA-binding protein